MNNWKNTLTNSYVSILIIGLFSVIFISQFAWKGNDNKGYSRMIASDGIGYYYYLPNTFLSKTIENQTSDKRFFNSIKEKGVNKYYVGTAVSMYPFFEIGYLLSDKGQESTGFEPSFHKSISLAGLFYLIGGLLFLRAFLRQYKFKEWIISAILLLLFFGTNLMAYAILMPSMSHVYSFFFVTGFLFFAKQFVLYQKSIHLFIGAAFLAMVILIRPLNGIIIFALPFLAGSLIVFKGLIFAVLKPKNIIISLVILFLILFIQAYFWHLQCGSWIVWSYGKEGFYFLSPYVYDVLFSFRKGAFVYTPLLIVSVIGLVALIQNNKFQGWSLFLFFAVLIYMVSSWWNWYYGPSFGQRPFVEFYSLSALLLAFAFRFIQSKMGRITMVVFGVLCGVLNLIQTYQYHKGILSSWDMNAKKYGYVFLKTNDDYINCLGGNNDIMLYKADQKLVHEEMFNFDSLPNGNINYSNSEFKFDASIPMNENFVTERGIYLLVNLKRKDLETSSKNGGLFVVEMYDEIGEKYHYSTFPVSEIPPRDKNEWQEEKYSIEIQEVKKSTSKMKIYIWNKEKQPFLIDDLKLNILAIE